MSMALDKMETSMLQIRDKMLAEYDWDFVIPPHSRIKQNMTDVPGAGGFVFSDLKFKTGFLANAYHKLMFAIYANQVNAYVILQSKTKDKKYELLRTGKLELFSQNNLKSTKELKFACDDMSHAPDPHNVYATVWINTDGSWDDTIDLMKLTIRVEYQELGSVIPYVNESIFNKLKLNTSPLELDASDMFLSKNLSDTTFVCNNEAFPAHRFILSCKSPVFKQMFQHETMKETREGQVVIDDMTPDVLKELLRFLYCGQVQNMKEMCLELFKAAEKYDIQVLKNQCELALVQNIDCQNAMSMYMIGDMYNGDVLKEKAVQTLKLNKSAVVPDTETFNEFTQQYPELMFQLYNL